MDQETTSPNNKKSTTLFKRWWAVVTVVILLVTLPVLPLHLVRLSDMTWRNLFGENVSLPSCPNKKVPVTVRSPIVFIGDTATQHVQLLRQASNQLADKVRAKPDDPSALNQLGLLLVALGEFDKAQKCFERAIDVSRRDLYNVNLAQRVCLQQGRNVDAAGAIQEVARLNIELTAAHSNLAKVYERLGEHNKVIAELDALNKEGTIGDTTNSKVSTADEYKTNPIVVDALMRGEALMQAHDFTQAMKVFKNVIAINPTIAVAHHQLGLAAAYTGNRQLAVSEMQTALLLAPNDATVHNNLGLTYQTLGNLAGAKDEYKKAVMLNPKLTEAAVNLGNLLCKQGNYTGAQRAFQTAVTANANDAVACADLATVMSLQGNYDSAIDEFQKALALDPNLACAHLGLGLAFLNVQNYSQSIIEFKCAQALNPKLAGVSNKIEEATKRLNNMRG